MMRHSPDWNAGIKVGGCATVGRSGVDGGSMLTQRLLPPLLPLSYMVE